MLLTVCLRKLRLFRIPMPFDLTLESEYVWRIVATILFLVAAVTLSRLLKRLTGRIVEEPTRQYRLAKIIGRTMALAFLVVLIGLWAPGPNTVVTVLTVLGAGTAISMREALLSIAGWFNLVIRQPYRVGDRIEINDIKGDVIDIRLLHTTLMEVGGWIEADQSTGRIVHVPNAWVYLHGLYNFNQGFNFVWNELSVRVSRDTDWQKARDLMLEMAKESAAVVESQAAGEIKRLSREYLVHYSILTPFVYLKIVDEGVQLTLRYLTEVRKRRGTEHTFTIAILERFKEHGIAFAGGGSGHSG